MFIPKMTKEERLQIRCSACAWFKTDNLIQGCIGRCTHDCKTIFVAIDDGCNHFMRLVNDEPIKND